MNVSICTHRPLLKTCALEDIEFQLDPYVGCEHYCYYCYALNQAETDWAEKIQIHRDIVKQLTQELAGIPPQTIYLGWNADPYSPSENKYRQTRQVLKLLLKMEFSATILTKSDLIVRDIDILKKMKNALVGISFAFNDENTRVLFEGNTQCNEARFEALSKLRDAGIRTYGMICPVFPHITDVELLIDKLVSRTDEIWIYNLSMEKHSDVNCQNTQAILSNHFPNSKELIEAAASSAQHPYWAELRQKLEKLRKERQLDLKICLQCEVHIIYNSLTDKARQFSEKQKLIFMRENENKTNNINPFFLQHLYLN